MTRPCNCMSMDECNDRAGCQIEQARREEQAEVAHTKNGHPVFETMARLAEYSEAERVGAQVSEAFAADQAAAQLVDLIADEATITAAREISDKLWDTIAVSLNDAKLSRMNLGMHIIDQAVQRSLPHSHMQMGIVFMVAVMCFRRILSENNITDRGHRMKILRATAAEFEKKLRQYATTG